MCKAEEAGGFSGCVMGSVHIGRDRTCIRFGALPVTIEREISCKHQAHILPRHFLWLLDLLQENDFYIKRLTRLEMWFCSWRTNGLGSEFSRNTYAILPAPCVREQGECIPTRPFLSVFNLLQKNNRPSYKQRSTSTSGRGLFRSVSGILKSDPKPELH